MPTCDVCGNQYDKAFQVKFGNDTFTFDSFECAIHKLAPNCENCGVKIVGHGLEANGKFFCCANCAGQKGVQDVKDRA